MIKDAEGPQRDIIPMLEQMKNVKMMLKARNHNEALLMLEGLNPDIVLLDTHFPPSNGTELLKVIRQNYEEIIVMILDNELSEINNR